MLWEHIFIIICGAYNRQSESSAFRYDQPGVRQAKHIAACLKVAKEHVDIDL